MGLINGTKRLITDSVNDLARNTAYKVMGKGNQAINDSFIDMTSKEINKFADIQEEEIASLPVICLFFH